MLFLFILGVILIVGVAFWLVSNPQKLQPNSIAEELPSGDRNVFTLQIGDIVQYEGADWVVEGKLTYDDNGYIWLEFMLQDGDRLRWLSVSEDDRVEVAWLEPTNTLELSNDPPPQLTFDGVSYQCVESGVAKMSRIGNIQRRPAETCRYFDYEGGTGNVLSVEDWNGEFEVSVGHRIRPSDLSLLPGGGNSVYRSI